MAVGSGVEVSWTGVAEGGTGDGLGVAVEAVRVSSAIASAVRNTSSLDMESISVGVLAVEQALTLKLPSRTRKHAKWRNRISTLFLLEITDGRAKMV